MKTNILLWKPRDTAEIGQPRLSGNTSSQRNGSRRLGDRGGHCARNPMNQVFALVDGNAFYRTCERLFRPDL